MDGFYEAYQAPLETHPSEKGANLSKEEQEQKVSSS